MAFSKSPALSMACAVLSWIQGPAAPGLPLRHNSGSAGALPAAHRNIPIPRACPRLSHASLRGVRRPLDIGPYRGSKTQPLAAPRDWSEPSGALAPASCAPTRHPLFADRRAPAEVRFALTPLPLPSVAESRELVSDRWTAAVLPPVEDPSRSWDWRLKPRPALLRVCAAPHPGVGLRQTGKSLHRRWPQSETAMIGIDRQRILSAQPGGIRQRKPEIRILWSGVHRALGMHRCIARVSVLRARSARLALPAPPRCSRPSPCRSRYVAAANGLRASLFRGRGRIRERVGRSRRRSGRRLSRDQQDCKPHPSPEP